MAITGAAASFTPAQAAAMPRLAAAAAEVAPDAGVVEVRHRRHFRHRGWRGNRHYRGRHYYGPRYSYRRHHNYRRYHHHHHRDNNDIGAAVAIGIIGLAAGAIIAGQAHGGSSYHSVCARKYRSYDPRSGTYLGYDGYRHRCRP
jgi:hypothetical protein